MVYRISNFIVLIVFILKFFIFYINAIPPPSPPMSTSTALHGVRSSTSISSNSCNCIRAEDCAAYAALMRQLKGVIERMRSIVCGLAYDSEPKVCCPTNARTTENKPERSTDTQAFNMHSDEFSTNTNERWIWERRPITKDDVERTTVAFNIQSKFLDDPIDYDFTSTNLIDDYYDWKTQRNCPPILFREKHNFFRRYFEQPQQHETQHFLYHPYPQPHPHHSPHDHHFEFNHNHNRHGHIHGHTDFSDEHGASVFPDSRHVFWPPPPNWPEEVETSATNHNRGLQTTTPITILTTFNSFTTTTPTITTASTTQKPIINSANCGVTFSKRIIGGIEALPGEFPWITRIAYLNKSDNSIAYRCSGSFITELHIITAAHCVTNLDESLTLSHISIADINRGVVDNQQESQNFYEIAETFVHPNFDTPKRTNDIALIKIRRPQGVAVNYGTICLPTLTNFGNSGTGVVAGWSNSEGTKEVDQRVRYLRLPILNNTECAKRYDRFRQGFAEKITIDRGMLCTQGLSNGSDVCRGDSGGPLMSDANPSDFNNEGRYTLIGIVAFGPICGFTNLLPGVYMRVSEFVGWINNTIG